MGLNRLRKRGEEDFAWAWEIIDREELAEELSELRQVPTFQIPPLVPAPTPLTFPETALRFLNPHQYVTVPAGGTKTVYSYRLPGNHLGVLQRVANSYYVDTEATWLVDGKSVYNQPIDREIAGINSPLELRPPIPVANRIEWKVINKSGEFDRDYHVLIDGISCHKSEYDLLLSWLKA